LRAHRSFQRDTARVLDTQGLVNLYILLQKQYIKY